MNTKETCCLSMTSSVQIFCSNSLLKTRKHYENETTFANVESNNLWLFLPWVPFEILEANYLVYVLIRFGSSSACIQLLRRYNLSDPTDGAQAEIKFSEDVVEQSTNFWKKIEKTPHQQQFKRQPSNMKWNYRFHVRFHFGYCERTLTIAKREALNTQRVLSYETTTQNNRNFQVEQRKSLPVSISNLCSESQQIHFFTTACHGENQTTFSN